MSEERTAPDATTSDGDQDGAGARTPVPPADDLVTTAHEVATESGPLRHTATAGRVVLRQEVHADGVFKDHREKAEVFVAPSPTSCRPRYAPTRTFGCTSPAGTPTAPPLYFAAGHTLAHLRLPPELRDDVTTASSPAGHMMYVHEPGRGQQSADLAGWVVAAAGRRDG